MCRLRHSRKEGWQKNNLYAEGDSSFIFFFYIGLSHSEGSRAAILNSLSVFSVVILACIFFKSDRMTLRKVVGCVIGFTGILSLNLGGTDSGRYTWLGDGMIILNALCGATASLLTRGLGKRLNVFVGTGYSLAIGGIILVVCGLLFGGALPKVTALGLLWLFLLICISMVGFTLYNKLPPATLSAKWPSTTR